jgi:hypothetical protein
LEDDRRDYAMSAKEDDRRDYAMSAKHLAAVVPSKRVGGRLGASSEH